MDIRINDQTLDVRLEKEKTIGEVLAALEEWMTNSGHILSGLCVDGEAVKVSQIEEVFKKEIDSVKCLDIQTNPVAELMASSLVTLLEDIKEYESLDFGKKTDFYGEWKGTACGRFLEAEIPDLFALCVITFSNGAMDTASLASLTEERLREITEPVKEFTNIEPVLDEICLKLVDLPLDIQTGKDKKAAQTMQLFTALTEKIFRIYFQIDTQGIFIEENTEKKEQIIRQITEFTDVLKELLEAYEKNDSVLVGDLTEYEASVRIKEIYSAIMENCRRSTQ